MAGRPWVLSKEVKAYTDIGAVQKRKKEKLKMDIFTDCAEIPAPVKTAVILLAEAYASYANQLKKTGGGALKSETFDDYSWSGGEGTFEDLVKSLDLAALLDDFVVPQASGTVTMRMRRL